MLKTVFIFKHFCEVTSTRKVPCCAPISNKFFFWGILPTCFDIYIHIYNIISTSEYIDPESCSVRIPFHIITYTR